MEQPEKTTSKVDFGDGTVIEVTASKDQLPRAIEDLRRAVSRLNELKQQKTTQA